MSSFAPVLINPRVPVIGFCGYARSGKDTAAGFLIEQNWRRLAFADNLKADLCKLLGITLEELDEKKAALRPLMVEYGRAARALNPDVWVRRLAVQVQRLAVQMQFEVGAGAQGIVITDVRYPNEAEWVRSLCGITVKVTREGLEPANREEAESVPKTKCDWEITAASGQLDVIKTEALRIAAAYLTEWNDKYGTDGTRT